MPGVDSENRRPGSAATRAAHSTPVGTRGRITCPLDVRFIVILNPAAGKAGAPTTPEELRMAFSRAGVDADIRVPPGDEIADTLRAAVAARPDAVIAGGGDGTVRCAAAVLAHTGVPLGVLPLGTLNHFAKDLRMPVKLEEAISVLAAATTRDVDVGEVNGHVFINNCSLGAYAEAVRRRDRLRERHGIGKWWAMIRASFGEFRRLRRLRLRIAAGRGAREQAVRTPVVVVGNNRYSGQLLRQNLRPRLDEGRLWLYTVRARRHLAVLRMMLQSLLHRLDDADDLAAEPVTEIKIFSDSGPVPIAADGEVLPLSAPFHFRIRPRALRVIVPGATSEPVKARESALPAKEPGTVAFSLQHVALPPPSRPA